jgi:ribosomal subunit interface protein
MKHNIKTLEIFLTPAITDYVDKRIDHLDKFVSPDMQETAMCYAEVGKSSKHHKNGDIFVAEFTIHIGGKSFRAKKEEYDLYAAIDKAVEEMAEELRTFKDKRVGMLKRGGAKIKSLLKGLY